MNVGGGLQRRMHTGGGIVIPPSVGREPRARFSVVTSAFLLAVVVLPAFAPPASAQIPREELKCITQFNKNIRKLAKTHGKIVRKKTDAEEEFGDNVVVVDRTAPPSEQFELKS